MLIVANPGVNAVEVQWVARTHHGGDLFPLFHFFEVFFTLIFIAESARMSRTRAPRSGARDGTCSTSSSSS